ncbi:hypothetical protein OMCYN_00111 [cyanobiont of Ornithocercus magnificus]|nr:hypothetical protein OMCYN_00111 [cyanobiont of Ornithocercus magnificus]
MLRIITLTSLITMLTILFPRLYLSRHKKRYYQLESILLIPALQYLGRKGYTTLADMGSFIVTKVKLRSDFRC